MKFAPHKNQVLVILPDGTASFSCEDEFIKHMLQTVPLQSLLFALQQRTSEFVVYKKALEKLKEVVDGVTAAGVAEVLTAPPILPQPKHDDHLDAFRFKILNQYAACSKPDFRFISIDGNHDIF